jgi:CxxC motif-containing protein
MKELICIGCPLGCRLQVETEGQRILSVKGYVCKRGKVYAEDEILRPRRMVTSLIAVPGSRIPLSVRTRTAIPKDLIEKCLRAIRASEIILPVKIGDVIHPDLLGTGVDLIATRDLPESDPDVPWEISSGTRLAPTPGPGA